LPGKEAEDLASMFDTANGEARMLSRNIVKLQSSLIYPQTTRDPGFETIILGTLTY